MAYRPRRADAPYPPQTLTAEADVAVVPKILVNGSEFTGTQNVIVGQKISLSYSTGGATVTNPSWSVPGTTTGGYNVTYTNPDGDTEALAPDAALNVASPIFYWVDGGSSRTVT